MALRRKTGGRDFPKGHTGRPKGIKEKLPRSAKRIVEHLLETYGTDLALLDAAMRRGLKARPGPAAAYCKMVIEHLKGAPDQHIDVASALAQKFTHELHPGPSQLPPAPTRLALPAVASEGKIRST